MAMLDFILEFERVLKQWPEGNNWSITQIADYTGSSIPQVVDILGHIGIGRHASARHRNRLRERYT